jgi:hypothetical protein
MPRIEKSYCSPAKPELICPVKGCGKECRAYGGLTQHIQAKHKEYQPGTPSAAVVDDFIVPDSDLSSVNDPETYFSPDRDPAGTWDAFDSQSNHDSIGFDFENQSSRPDSPSRESEALNVDYHPIING